MSSADRITEKSKRTIKRITRNEYLKIHEWIHSVKDWIIQENPSYETITQKANENGIQCLPKHVLKKLFEYNQIEFYLFRDRKKYKSRTSEIIKILEKLNQDQRNISIEIAEMKKILSENINKRNDDLNFLLEEVSKALPSHNSEK